MKLSSLSLPLPVLVALLTSWLTLLGVSARYPTPQQLKDLRLVKDIARCPECLEIINVMLQHQIDYEKYFHWMGERKVTVPLPHELPRSIFNLIPQGHLRTMKLYAEFQHQFTNYAELKRALKSGYQFRGPLRVVHRFMKALLWAVRHIPRIALVALSYAAISGLIANFVNPTIAERIKKAWQADPMQFVSRLRQPGGTDRGNVHSLSPSNTHEPIILMTDYDDWPGDAVSLLFNPWMMLIAMLVLYIVSVAAGLYFFCFLAQGGEDVEGSSTSGSDRDEDEVDKEVETSKKTKKKKTKTNNPKGVKQEKSPLPPLKAVKMEKPVKQPVNSSSQSKKKPSIVDQGKIRRKTSNKELTPKKSIPASGSQSSKITEKQSISGIMIPMKKIPSPRTAAISISKSKPILTNNNNNNNRQQVALKAKSIPSTGVEGMAKSRSKSKIISIGSSPKRSTATSTTAKK